MRRPDLEMLEKLCELERSHEMTGDGPAAARVEVADCGRRMWW
jgi:hypothetical protein